MTCSIERAVVGVRPFCIIADQEEEVEFHIAPNQSSEGPCRMYLVHAEHPPEEQLLPNEEQTLRWKSPGLSAGILTVLTVVEREEGGVWASSATPVLVLPREAAEEMREIFETTIRQEMKSALLLSTDCQLNDAQQTAMHQAIWHNHIRSFAVDLDFLLNDLDDGSGSDGVAPEKMCDMLLKVFRNVFEFLKKLNAHHTLHYLIQACKERGVISFYAKYDIEQDESTKRATADVAPLALYEEAEKCWNDDFDGSDEDDDAGNNNNDVDAEGSSEFDANFGISNCGVGFVGDSGDDYGAKSRLFNEDEMPVVVKEDEQQQQHLNVLQQSFDEFSREGAFRRHHEDEYMVQDRAPVFPDHSVSTLPPSPRGRESAQEIQEDHRRSPRTPPMLSSHDIREPSAAPVSNIAVHVAGSSMSLNAFVFPVVVVVLCLVAARVLETFKASYLITVLTFSLLSIPVYRVYRRLLNLEFKMLSRLVVASTLVAAYSLMVSCIAQGLDRNK